MSSLYVLNLQIIVSLRTKCFEHTVDSKGDFLFYAFKLPV